MNLIKSSIDRPIAVVSAVIMVVLFGWLALKTIPIQLAPDVNRPVISITTIWPGAAPAEIEREITIRQEEVLKGIQKLRRMCRQNNLSPFRRTDCVFGNNGKHGWMKTGLGFVDGYDRCRRWGSEDGQQKKKTKCSVRKIGGCLFAPETLPSHSELYPLV